MKMNVIIVYDYEEKNILMCLRSKEPYKGLYNLVGGKVEVGEEGIDSAYRELFEETGISNKDIMLIHLMDFYYYMDDVELQVYTGKLNKEVKLVEEEHKLLWENSENNFFNINRYAGEGNIGHMIEVIKKIKIEIRKTE
jgi:8-oxo-dGTP diphosphatase